MTLEDIIARLDGAAAVLWNDHASAASLIAATEEARLLVRAIDEAEGAALERRAGALAAMTAPAPRPGQLRPMRPPIGKIVAHLEAIDADRRRLQLPREIAGALAAQLEARLPFAEKAEALLDQARLPYAEQTRRARELAQRINEFSPLVKRLRALLRADIAISILGRNAASRTPSNHGAALMVYRTFDVPRLLAREEFLASARLPGFWSSRDRLSDLERDANWRDPDDNLEHLVGPLAAMVARHDRKEIVISEASAYDAIDRAQAALLSEFSKTCAAIRELLKIDASVSPEDRAARYPDGGLIFDPALFPDGWRLGAMSRFVALPSTDGLARAAE